MVGFSDERLIVGNESCIYYDIVLPEVHFRISYVCEKNSERDPQTPSFNDTSTKDKELSIYA